MTEIFITFNYNISVFNFSNPLLIPAAYLCAEIVESVINVVESGVVVLSLSIDHLIKVLPVFILSQANALQMLQNVLHIGVRSRMVRIMARRRTRGSGS
jgi:hypothetical protein